MQVTTLYCSDVQNGIFSVHSLSNKRIELQHHSSMLNFTHVSHDQDDKATIFSKTGQQSSLTNLL